MVLLPIEKVPLGISTTWYFYVMVLLPIDRTVDYTLLTSGAVHTMGSGLEPEPDRIWILNRSHITGSGLPDSVDPAQYPDINPDIRL